MLVVQVLVGCETIFLAQGAQGSDICSSYKLAKHSLASLNKTNALVITHVFTILLKAARYAWQLSCFFMAVGDDTEVFMHGW